MRIGLVSFVCKNRDISFNMSQIERALREAQGKVDLLCFGEAYLQGFDCLCWDYAVDKEMALELNSQAICQLREWSKAYGTALLRGKKNACTLPVLSLMTAKYCTITGGSQKAGKNIGKQTGTTGKGIKRGNSPSIIIKSCLPCAETCGIVWRSSKQTVC